MKRALQQIWRRLRQPVIVRRRRQAGIALIIVTVTIAVLGAVVGDFSFNARVDLEAAANARDTLRAEYLARSGIQLSRLLIKVQQSVLDKNRQFIGDIQIVGLRALPHEGVRRRVRRARGPGRAARHRRVDDEGARRRQERHLRRDHDLRRRPHQHQLRRRPQPQPAAGAGALRPARRALLAAALRQPAVAHLGLARLRRTDREPRRHRARDHRLDRPRHAAVRADDGAARRADALVVGRRRRSLQLRRHARIRTCRATTSTTRSRSSTSCAASATTSGAPSARC